MASTKVGFHSLNGKYVVLLIPQIPRAGCSEGYLFQDVTLIIENRTQCPLWCARPLQLLSLPLQSLISFIQKAAAAALEHVTPQLMHGDNCHRVHWFSFIQKCSTFLSEKGTPHRAPKIKVRQKIPTEKESWEVLSELKHSGNEFMQRVFKHFLCCWHETMAKSSSYLKSRDYGLPGI